MSVLPNRLKDDAIVEALAEVRFESQELPEVILGRLSDADPWKGFKKVRLPISDVPAPIRIADPNLKFQAALEVQDESRSHVVKIGANVLSYHLIGVHKYVGWEEFEPILWRTFSALFSVIQGVTVNRLGLRYTNALTSDRHFVNDISSLNLSLMVADQPLSEPLNLNFQSRHTDTHMSMTRIASPGFVQGQLPDNTTAVIDVDVFSLNCSVGSLDDVMKWINLAHEFEKMEFFRLIPNNIVANLKEG